MRRNRAILGKPRMCRCRVWPKQGPLPKSLRSQQWGAAGRVPHWSCTGSPKGDPKPWDNPQQGMWGAFPFPVPLVGAKSLIPLGSAATPGPPVPPPHTDPGPSGGAGGPGPPRVLPAQVEWPWQVAPGPWAVVPGGRAMGKVWVSGCQGWVPPGLGVWGTPVPSPSPPSSCRPAALGALVLCPWMCLCPCAPIPNIPMLQLGTEQGPCRGRWLLFAALNSTKEEIINSFFGRINNQ